MNTIASQLAATENVNQDQLKTQVGEAALAYVPRGVTGGAVVGVGTGSTVNKFIDALPMVRAHVGACVSSSIASTARLEALGFKVIEASAVQALSVYIDGADEINHQGQMIKGGGAALTREKIVAAMAEQFVCIADISKLVNVLGRFALPVEVIPMAVPALIRQFAQLGGVAQLRTANGQPMVTDNGQHLLDVRGLSITDPLAFECDVSQWPGVVTVGVFARQHAHVCLLGGPLGVQTLRFEA